jgi:hypothetical protein
MTRQSRCQVVVGLAATLCLGAVFTSTVMAAGPEKMQAGDLAARASTTLDGLGKALDTARVNPSAGRPGLTDAVAALGSLIDDPAASDGDRARLFFDRALAESALGDHAAALLDFKRSDALRPTSAAMRHIEQERARLNAKPDDPPAGSASAMKSPAPTPLGDRAMRVARFVPAGIRWWGGIGALGLFWLLLALRWVPAVSPFRASLRPVAVLLVFVAVLGLGTVIAEVRAHRSCQEAVVLGAPCIPRAGPDAVAYPPATFEGEAVIPRGREVCIVETRDVPGRPGWPAWFRIGPSRDAGGSQTADEPGVWVAAGDVGLVHPSSY